MPDDPCDEWPVWSEWSPMYDNRHRPTHHNLTDVKPFLSLAESRPWHLDRFNCRGDYVIPQKYLCHAGQHRWTEWTDYEPVWRPLEPVIAPPDAVPTDQPVEAYRWRHCECGAREREAWADHKREIFLP